MLKGVWWGTNEVDLTEFFFCTKEYTQRVIQSRAEFETSCYSSEICQSLNREFHRRSISAWSPRNAEATLMFQKTKPPGTFITTGTPVKWGGTGSGVSGQTRGKSHKVTVPGGEKSRPGADPTGLRRSGRWMDSATDLNNRKPQRRQREGFINYYLSSCKNQYKQRRETRHGPTQRESMRRWMLPRGLELLPPEESKQRAERTVDERGRRLQFCLARGNRNTSALDRQTCRRRFLESCL